ncbi:hypothetical protein QJQ45_010635 [Haematococcus lacustris]|nr:hypothetical protein QJQ45_010635 [Haematococcus lacustris]
MPVLCFENRKMPDPLHPFLHQLLLRPASPVDPAQGGLWAASKKAGRGQWGGEDKNERECVAAARSVFELSLTASSLALALQRLELACAFLLTDRLWAVAMADLAQLAVGLHANTAQRRLLRAPSTLNSPRPASLTPTAAGPTAMGGQQGPGWVEKLEPFWQLFVAYVVDATAGTEHNLVRQQGEGGWEVLLAMAGRMRKRFRSTAAKIPKPRVAAVVSSLMQALVAAREARCLRLHQQLGAACNVTSQGNSMTAAEQVSPQQAAGPSVGVGGIRRAASAMSGLVSSVLRGRTVVGGAPIRPGIDTPAPRTARRRRDQSPPHASTTTQRATKQKSDGHQPELQQEEQQEQQEEQWQEQQHERQQRQGSSAWGERKAV